MSQKSEILEHLQKGNTLTHLECEDLFNCSRLAARANDLKKEGEPVESRMITTRTGKHVAQYYYVAHQDLFPERMPIDTDAI